LPFASASVGAVRTDRVLQHVDSPERALDELVRVVRAGGVAVFAEPDQSTLRIDGTDPALTPDIVRYRAEVGIRNGMLAGQLGDGLRDRGFVDLVQESCTIEIADPARALGLPIWPSSLVERGWWTRDAAQAFSASLDAAVADGTFRYSFDIVVTCGRRP
jgi:SAM-dependent methyltransferase